MKRSLEKAEGRLTETSRQSDTLERAALITVSGKGKFRAVKADLAPNRFLLNALHLPEHSANADGSRMVRSVIRLNKLRPFGMAGEPT
jgi:hypothetical protein